MENEALPEAPAVEVSTPKAVTPETFNEDGTPVLEEPKEEPKPEKTEAERERIRMQRGIDRKTRQAASARAEAEFYKQELTRLKNGVNYQEPEADSEPLSLTRAQFAEAVKAEAVKLAPTLQTEVAERQRREGVVQSLQKSWGQEKFDTVAADLNEAFGGDDRVNALIDARGMPIAAMEAILESETPGKVIEYLSNPDNMDEAERISRMSAVQASRAITKLETKLSAEVAPGKPIPSKVPAPLEPVRSNSPKSGGLPQDNDSIEEWLRKENARMKAAGIRRYG